MRGEASGEHSSASPWGKPTKRPVSVLTQARVEEVVAGPVVSDGVVVAVVVIYRPCYTSRRNTQKMVEDPGGVGDGGWREWGVGGGGMEGWGEGGDGGWGRGGWGLGLG